MGSNVQSGIKALVLMSLDLSGGTFNLGYFLLSVVNERVVNRFKLTALGLSGGRILTPVYSFWRTLTRAARSASVFGIFDISTSRFRDA